MQSRRQEPNRDHYKRHEGRLGAYIQEMIFVGNEVLAAERMQLDFAAAAQAPLGDLSCPAIVPGPGPGQRSAALGVDLQQLSPALTVPLS